MRLADPRERILARFGGGDGVQPLRACFFNGGASP
jgi:hypothetical protein